MHALIDSFILSLALSFTHSLACFFFLLIRFVLSISFIGSLRPLLHAFVSLFHDVCCSSVCAGALLPFAAAPPAESALYHHGEEPGRAGYTVDDMFRLARSAVQQQRVLGLQTIANLLTKVTAFRRRGHPWYGVAETEVVNDGVGDSVGDFIS